MQNAADGSTEKFKLGLLLISQDDLTTDTGSMYAHTLSGYLCNTILRDSRLLEFFDSLLKESKL